MQARWLSTAAAWSALVLQSAAVHGADEASAEADAAAQQAYQRAEAAYAAKDLPGALQEMERAYQLSKRADLLYNLARIEDELGQCAAARAHYRQYLERVPQGEARTDAQVADERLAVRCGAAEKALTATAAVTPPVPAAAPSVPLAQPKRPIAEPPPLNHESATQRWVGWSLVAGGVVAGVGSAYFWGSALDSRNSYQASVNREVAGGPHSDPGLLDDHKRELRVSYALGVSSAALLVGGAVVVLLAPRLQSSTRRAAVQVQPDLIAATYAQSF